MEKESKTDGTGKTFEFSIMCGGLLYWLMSRAGLTRSAPLVPIAWLITWCPLLLLSMTYGQAVGSSVQVPFLYDVVTCVRFLIVVPLFFLAEDVTGPRVSEAAVEFVRTGVVGLAEQSRYQRTIQKSLKITRSIAPEVIILIAVIIAAALGMRMKPPAGVTTWEHQVTAGAVKMSAAGWWYVCVALPAYQFLLMRWVWRYLTWVYFLWKTSRLSLHLVPTHPDEAGGLGFLGVAQSHFAPFVLAVSSSYVSALAEMILYGGAPLGSLEVQASVFIGALLVILLAPLFVFAPKLITAKRRGLLDYGAVAAAYVDSFDRKWKGEAAGGEAFLGSPDIQSLANMGSSFELVKKMNWAPFGLTAVAALGSALLVPFVLLLIAIHPPEEIIRVVKEILL